MSPLGELGAATPLRIATLPVLELPKLLIASLITYKNSGIVNVNPPADTLDGNLLLSA